MKIFRNLQIQLTIKPCTTTSVNRSHLSLNSANFIVGYTFILHDLDFMGFYSDKLPRSIPFFCIFEKGVIIGLMVRWKKCV